MKELRFNEVLRYALSGGIALATFFILQPCLARRVLQLEALKTAAFVGGTILLIGVFLYNLHRALIFPVLLRIALLLVLGQTDRERKTSEGFKFWFPYRPALAEINLDLWRWSQETTRKHWDEWGAQVHFLYCSAWAILLALLIGRYSSKQWGNLAHSKAALSVALVALVAAVVHHLRLLYLMTSIRRGKPAAPESEPAPEKPSNPSALAEPIPPPASSAS
jgi:cellobiose-specific phosphotransferase system component IIC